MTDTQKINKLWAQFREAINTAYKVSQRPGNALDDENCLHDYAENVSMQDDLAALLGRETANERRHRRNSAAPAGFSAGTAAMLILMRNAADGAFLTEMPKATKFLVLRQTAVEAEVIGYLARHALTGEWCKAVREFDYAEMMNRRTQ